MKYIAAYLLAQTAGIEEPTAKDVKKIVTDVGGEVDGDRVDELFKQLEGKNVKELIEEAMKKLANVGGGAPAAGGAAPASKAPAAEAKPAAAAAPAEESEEDMGFGLFD
eukprot:Rhum_TRINITY_DN24645_c0_g1::Rhum_TRINITY_DN24645_c0_g1_i1::g.179978::m.179978/K02943/RP-LP2, RPLP2; large subunit ribosomal protein LP2